MSVPSRRPGFPVGLPVLRWGGDGPRVLALHGLSASARLWWRIGSELARLGHRVVAPDLRGHGAAPPADSYHLEELASDVLDLGSGWDVVVGHSLGGSVAALAALEPGFCRCLVLLDPVVAIPDEERESLRAAQLAELEQTDPAALGEANPSWHAEDAYWKAQAAASTSPHVVAAVFDDNPSWDLTRRLEGIAVPTVLVAADREAGGLIDPEMGRRLAGINSHLRFEIAAGVGHAIPREAPDLVVRLIVASQG